MAGAKLGKAIRLDLNTLIYYRSDSSTNSFTNVSGYWDGARINEICDFIHLDLATYRRVWVNSDSTTEYNYTSDPMPSGRTAKLYELK